MCPWSGPRRVPELLPGGTASRDTSAPAPARTHEMTQAKPHSAKRKGDWVQEVMCGPSWFLRWDEGVIGRTLPGGSLPSLWSPWLEWRAAPEGGGVCLVPVSDRPPHPRPRPRLLSYLHSVRQFGSCEQLSFLDTRHGDLPSCAGLVPGSANNMRKEWLGLSLEVESRRPNPSRINQVSRVKNQSLSL